MWGEKEDVKQTDHTELQIVNISTETKIIYFHSYNGTLFSEGKIMQSSKLKHTHLFCCFTILKQKNKKAQLEFTENFALLRPIHTMITIVINF